MESVTYVISKQNSSDVLLAFNNKLSILLKKVYRFVPMINLKNNNEIDWSKSIAQIDNQLFNIFAFNNKEIEFINNNIKDM